LAGRAPCAVPPALASVVSDIFSAGCTTVHPPFRLSRPAVA